MQGGPDLHRHPRQPGQFLYGLDLDALALREELRSLHAPWAKLQIRFNLNYGPAAPHLQPGPDRVGPRSPRPELWGLFLPYRF